MERQNRGGLAPEEAIAAMVSEFVESLPAR